MSWQNTEKRRFPRANLPCKIIVHTPKESVIATITENIGAGGVRVIIDEAIEVSSMVGLEIEVNSSVVSCKGRVTWMVPRRDLESSESLGYDTGIEFYQISQKDQELIKKLVEAIISKEQ
ncbi:MAG: PilZ domain-containing protein [Candidatus Omnitrophica bacterium]|nr:PilZ domain-containing protein [Candidatus Omnitrophota bacterium]